MQKIKEIPNEELDRWKRRGNKVWIHDDDGNAIRFATVLRWERDEFDNVFCVLWDHERVLGRYIHRPSD